MSTLISGFPPVVEDIPSRRVYVRSPLQDNPQLCQVIGTDVTICVDGPIHTPDYPLLRSFAAKHESVSVALSTELQNPSVAFLSELPTLRDLTILASAFSDFASLAQAPATLKSLTLGPYGNTRQSLDFIKRFQNLESLTVTEYSKDIDAISSLKKLRYLHLHKVKLDDLKFLRYCESLLELRIWLGSLKSLEGAATIPHLRFLELSQVRNIVGIGPLADASHLQHLALEKLPHVTALPSFAGSNSLRRVSLFGLPALSDLSPLGQAPHLEEIVIGGNGKMLMPSLECFRGHPTLRAASFGFGSESRNDEARAFMRLPDVDDHFRYTTEHA